MKNNPSFALQILDFVAQSPSGRTFSEIQKFSFKLSHPEIPCFTHANRGHGCINLLGGRQSKNGHGIVTAFCTKFGNRYFRNHLDHGGKPYKVMNKLPYTFQNSQHRTSKLTLT